MKKGFLAPLIFSASLSCQAGNYFFEPVFNSNQRYNSNLFMREKPLQDNWITTVSPGLNLGLRHENGELKSNFTWNEMIYDNQSELNIAEQLFSSDYRYKGERFEWGLGGGYNNQSSINTENSVRGLVSTQLMRKQLSVEPSVTYLINELSSVTTDYSYNNTTYEKSGSAQNNVFFQDYDYHQASGTFNHLYTSRDKLNATLSSSLYKTKSQTTYNNVAQVGWQHSFSEQLVTFLSVGMNYSMVDTKVATIGNIGGSPVYLDPVTNQLTLEQPVVHKTNFGQVYRASIQKSFEKGSVSLVGSQNQAPTSLGLQTQTTLSINPSYNINDRWSSGLSASYNKTDMAGLSTSPYNRSYYSVGPNINWKCSPEINLGLSYTYQQQEYQSASQTSTGNIAQIQFSYQPQINRQVK